MTKREELDNFLRCADDLISGKYILADIKIVNLLKSIAVSDTILAVFKYCLDGFDYEEAKQKYFVRTPYLSSDKAEFVLPSNSKELLAFIFNVLMDIDSKRISLAEFLDKYFYEDGSCYSGYTAFLNSMIKPFKNSVKVLVESVIDGKIQDPVEAVIEEEKRKQKEEIDRREKEEREKEISEKTYGENIKKIKELLVTDKTKVKESKLSIDKKQDATLVIDMLANVIESGDKDAIDYAFVAYKYMTASNKFMFIGRVKLIKKLLGDIINGL
ncbi:MAG: hypothetical protein E7369_03280 [Clostridiales bacterium]|nr:hypothetical protein [Clostridiales bacterium]